MRVLNSRWISLQVNAISDVPCGVSRFGLFGRCEDGEERVGEPREAASAPPAGRAADLVLIELTGEVAARFAEVYGAMVSEDTVFADHRPRAGPGCPSGSHLQDRFPRYKPHARAV